MVAETPHPVAIIHNAGDTAMPKGNPIQHLQLAVERMPANVYTAIAVIGLNAFARMVVSLVLKVGTSTRSESYHVVNSLEKAYALIEEQESIIEKAG